MQTAYLKTPLGIAEITGDARGVSKISIGDFDIKNSPEISEILELAVNQLEAYFTTKHPKFTFKTHLQGTDFQKKVWHELSKIPFGKTISYLELAKNLGDVKAVRAVAAANARNPIWIVVPCHRVIGSDGSLTGYAGGVWRKKWLLEHENPSNQPTLF